jgi:hypothetical protein
VTWFKCYPGICLEKLRNTTRSLSQDNRTPDEDPAFTKQWDPKSLHRSFRSVRTVACWRCNVHSEISESNIVPLIPKLTSSWRRGENILPSGREILEISLLLVTIAVYEMRLKRSWGRCVKICYEAVFCFSYFPCPLNAEDIWCGYVWCSYYLLWIIL